MTSERVEPWEVIIIGGGPTGLTAGLYTARAKLATLVLEGQAPGGQMIVSDLIENFPGFPEGIYGAELAGRIAAQASRFGVEIETGVAQALRRADDRFVVEVEDGRLTARAVIVATGGRHKKLGVPGERELRGHGVSYCATCDGALFPDKRIAVVGGGSAAVDEAIFLTRFATRVYLLHRRDQLRAERLLQERAFANPKIEIVWNSVVTAIEGDARVERIAVRNVKSGEDRRLSVEAVFVAIGLEPNTGFLPPEVETDEAGFILADRQGRTNVPGLFACGDVVSGALRQLTTSVGDAAWAAHSAQEFLAERSLPASAPPAPPVDRAPADA